MCIVKKLMVLIVLAPVLMPVAEIYAMRDVDEEIAEEADLLIDSDEEADGSDDTESQLNEEELSLDGEGLLPTILDVQGWQSDEESKQENALFDAIEQEDDVAVLKALQEGAEVNALDEDGKSPLMHAVDDGLVDIARILLDHKADVDCLNPGGVTSLASIASINWPDMASLLLERKANVHAKMKANVTMMDMALHLGGNAPVVKLLLEHKIDVNEVDRRGNSYLLRATENGDADTVSVLIDGKADIELSNDEGKTPLLTACWGSDEEVVRILLEKKADIEKADGGGELPLLAACYSHKKGIVKILLEAGADVIKAYKQEAASERSYYGDGYRGVARSLLEGGVDVDAENREGVTLLRLAIKEKKPDLARMLVFAGADPYRENRYGYPPLKFANEDQMRSVLIDTKQDKDMVDEQDWLPEWLLESQVLDQFLPIKGLCKFVDEYATHYTQDKKRNKGVREYILDRQVAR